MDWNGLDWIGLNWMGWDGIGLLATTHSHFNQLQLQIFTEALWHNFASSPVWYTPPQKSPLYCLFRCQPSIPHPQTCLSQPAHSLFCRICCAPQPRQLLHDGAMLQCSIVSDCESAKLVATNCTGRSMHNAIGNTVGGAVVSTIAIPF